MPIDQLTIQRLSRHLADALEELLAPLREEVAELRAAIEEARTRSGQDAPGPAPANRPAERPVPTSAGVARRTIVRPSTTGLACAVPHCEAPVLAKQLCETHYRIMRRMSAAGEKFDPRSQRPSSARTGTRGCREAGCTEPHYAKGLCRRHYMSQRARERNQPRQGSGRTARMSASAPASAPAPAAVAVASEEAPELGREAAASVDSEPEIIYTSSESNVVAMPTAEVVSRVVSQYRGGLSKVAEVLGRNRRNLMELLEKLNLMEHVVQVRATERKKILAAPLKERLSDLLFKEKLLEDLGCLKDIDENTRRDVQLRLGQLAKNSSTIEEALQLLGNELGLDESGLKRLVWRFDLRRKLRDMKLKPANGARPRS
jgi:hypothetical protein